MTLAGKISVNTSYIAIEAFPGDEEGMSSCFSESSLNIKDFLFVSGKSQLGTVIFRNRKCATCNNATDIREWNLETGYCPEVAETSNIAELIELLLYNCTLASVPSASDRDYLDMYRCFNHDVIATCNNASSQHVSPEVRQMCEIRSPMFRHNFFVNKYGTYRKYYCFLCNNPYTVPSPTCKFQDDKANFGPSFSFIIDISLSDNTGETTLEGKCETTQIFDPYLVSIIITLYMLCTVCFHEVLVKLKETTMP